MDNIIETRNLTKKFGNVTAVNNVSLNIVKGEIYGFLGLNGAGKTTTIRLLLGLINPSEGDIIIFKQRIKRGKTGPWDKIGSLVEIPYAYPELTVRENLNIYRRLRGIKDRKTVTDIIEKVKLDQYADRKAGQLSLGNSQRLGLAKALMHNPEILLLDEPANGLDPAGIVEIRELLKDLSENNATTIFISSHILSEVSKIANRIGIIHNGKLLQELNSAELEGLVEKQLRIQTRNNDLALKVLKNDGLSPMINKNDEIVLSDSKSLDHPEDIASLFAANSIPLLSLFRYEEDLEAYFLRLLHQYEY
jgi:ABC-2 type transport system ATP-binding protein